jgi:hypothetical protein
VVLEELHQKTCEPVEMMPARALKFKNNMSTQTTYFLPVEEATMTHLPQNELHHLTLLQLSRLKSEMVHRMVN